MRQNLNLHSTCHELILFCLLAIIGSLVNSSAVGQEQKTEQKVARKAEQKKASPKKIITVKIKENNKTYYGRPLAWDGKKLALLRWDGRISQIKLSSTKLNIFSEGFAPYTTQELSKRLIKQYGDRYVLSTSKHFIVVHPLGAKKDWAAPYETVYNRFENYFAERNFELEEPQFPMVVIVLASRNEFDREIQNEITYKKNVFGFYSRMTNRVTSFVTNDPRSRQRLKKIQASTLVHETVHQAAFNTGVHNRLCNVPRWLSEGLAMMFEARGVSNRKKWPRAADRINRERLLTLRKMYQADIGKGKLKFLVQSDKLFESEPQFAYALSWGLTFYLAEKKQAEYFEFLNADAHRQEFLPYPPDERISNFVKTFQTDFKTLDNDLEKFILSLPIPLK